ncbi:aminotransferase class V-fold PLP-dependent enzyme [Paenibacillus sp. NFR01]|uniref:aminotransferase class V-fold PLP-dependent enzyme n=1 Tax=Paenibacillus sp. NFR01 TaxID=1566279 RepID=UPI0008C4DC31|nr:aminotransferase class V-fold PLP-dependent enzyme [Paenibacillus sp. NFR01]SEU08308.1 cysteine desulfurase family protein [Paenibacillus sp. NFR01]
MERLVYLDHAATSWPKPSEVAAAMMDALDHAAANAGRGNYSLALDTGRVLMRARMQLAELFGVTHAHDIAFTHNTTMGLNMAIQGFLRPGDHVLSTMTEHNSVRRPLEHLRKSIGIEIDYVKADAAGQVDLHQMNRLFKTNTRMVICNHSSNLLGSILPVGDIGDLTKSHGATFLVDAAQSAGSIAIDVGSMNIDMLAFPGHKGLLGPQGTGGLYISPRIDLEPLLLGGTGSQSENSDQPTVRPDRYEAGTQNTVGIAGLLAGVNKIKSLGIRNIHQHEWQLVQRLMEGLERIPGLKLLGPAIGLPRSGIAAFTVEGQDSAGVAHQLDREYHIAVRAGMHCTPLAHQTADTMASGAVRASVGPSTTEEEVDYLLHAMNELYGSKNK